MSCSEEDDAYGPPLPPGFKPKNEDVGPALPPHLVKATSPQNQRKDRMGKDETDSSDSDSHGPSLPPRLLKSTCVDDGDESDSDDAYLPALPPNMRNHESKRKTSESEMQSNKYPKADSGEEDSEDDDDDDMYGPVLPPHLLKSKNQQSALPNGQRIKGPTLPAGFIPPESLSSFVNPEEEEEEEDSEEEEGPMVGPLPSAVPISKEEYRIQQLELRAKKMKDKLEGKFDESKPVKRETWMLELPENKPNFCGLTARQFRKKAPLPMGDRTVWTDTPVDKERKAEMEEVKEESKRVVSAASQERDANLTARVDKYNEEKRAKSLIDIHQKKLKEKAHSSGPKERVPFSREDDMNVNKFDDAQKSNILKKAAQLNDRFNPGDRKFL